MVPGQMPARPGMTFSRLRLADPARGAFQDETQNTDKHVGPKWNAFGRGFNSRRLHQGMAFNVSNMATPSLQLSLVYIAKVKAFFFYKLSKSCQNTPKSCPRLFQALRHNCRRLRKPFFRAMPISLTSLLGFIPTVKDQAASVSRGIRHPATKTSFFQRQLTTDFPERIDIKSTLSWGASQGRNGQNEPDGEVGRYVCLKPKVLGATRTKRFSLWTCLMIAEDSESLSRVTPNSFSTAAMISVMCSGLPAAFSTVSIMKG